MHTAFITGCATGFGHRLAARLLARGHRVVATDRDTAAWPARLGAPHPNLRVLQCDVRREDSVAAAAEAATAWGPVDVVVNNAGYAIFGTQEETPVDLVREMFEVNVFGAARVTRALLPSLRVHRGQVVQISSVAGRTVFPESGFYAATKYALEAMSEALFQECCTFGVRVRLIQPGSFDTRFLPTAERLSPQPGPDSPYAALRPLWTRRKLAVLEPPQDPERVVDAIVATLDDPTPFRRIPVGPDAERILAVRDALGPDRWSRLAGLRAGLRAEDADPELPDPADLPARLDAGSPPPAGLLAAWRHGHLDHWGDSEAGRAALDALERWARVSRRT